MEEFVRALAALPELFLRVEAQLAANTAALNFALEQLGNTRLYEPDAAHYLGVGTKTMYHYRQAGLPYEKVKRIISYRRKDLDAWRTTGRVHRS